MIRPQDKTFWFGRTFREFSALVLPFKGQPICYVEVGVWKGDSAAWMCENIITHPLARGHGIDPYQPDFKRGENEDAKRIACERLNRYPQFCLHFGKSQDVLRRWDGPKIDLLYLDGSHVAHDVLADWCFAFPHLKVESLVIFDDYGLSKRKTDGVQRVDVAVEAIEQCYKPFVERLGQFKLQAAFKIVKEPKIGELP